MLLFQHSTSPLPVTIQIIGNSCNQSFSFLHTLTHVHNGLQEQKSCCVNKLCCLFLASTSIWNIPKYDKYTSFIHLVHIAISLVPSWTQTVLSFLSFPYEFWVRNLKITTLTIISSSRYTVTLSLQLTLNDTSNLI